MKVTIEAENKEEAEELDSPKVWEKVFEFSLVGRCVENGLYEKAFSHTHLADPFWLIGKLFESIERLRHGRN